jgi:hypothetical protein
LLRMQQVYLSRSLFVKRWAQVWARKGPSGHPFVSGSVLSHAP